MDGIAQFIIVNVNDKTSGDTILLKSYDPSEDTNGY